MAPVILRTGFERVKHTIAFTKGTLEKGEKFAFCHIKHIEEYVDENINNRIIAKCIQQILVTGTPYKLELEVIHISLKVANIHAKMGYLKEAEIGYQWCLEKLLTHKSNEDVKELRGIILDYYAQLNVRNKNYKEAIDNMEKSYNICQELFGDKHEQTIKMLNDLASVYWQANDVNNAENCFRKSIELVKQLPEEEQYFLGVLKSNLGILLLQKNLFEQAEQLCREAWNIAKRIDDSDVLNQANYCLNQVLKNKNIKK